MKIDANNWLTWAELVRQSNLDDTEAQRLIKEFGWFLAPRNFGDIVKYPAPVADLLVRLNSLGRLGWTVADLKNLLIMTRQEIREDCQANRFGLLEELRVETASLLKGMKIVINFGSQMQAALISVAQLLTSIDSFIESMLDQEKKLHELRAQESQGNIPSQPPGR